MIFGAFIGVLFVREVQQLEVFQLAKEMDNYLACLLYTSDGLAVYHVAHGPFPTRRRGRRPRRPFPSSTADPTTFRQSTRRGRVPSLSLIHI